MFLFRELDLILQGEDDLKHVLAALIGQAQVRDLKRAEKRIQPYK